MPVWGRGEISVSFLLSFAVNLKLLQKSLLKTKHTWPSLSLSGLGNEAPKCLITDQHEFPGQQTDSTNPRTNYQILSLSYKWEVSGPVGDTSSVCPAGPHGK